MIRRSKKKQLTDSLKLLTECHESLRNAIVDETERREILELAQSTAILVGEELEKDEHVTEAEASSVVTILEEYCENAWKYSAGDTEKLLDMEQEIEISVKKIEAMKSLCEVVFFPYKAEMWDCLESIWRAFAADPQCYVSVVPIPWFSANRKSGKWEAMYEAERFPGYVPVTHFREYDLEIEKPDIAFVHNPYDDRNYVTSVAPDYYSFNIKKHVQKLVYVPYYMAREGVPYDHRHLSVYGYMDYMICQSVHFKEECKNEPYYEKMLPLGSPKVDQLLQFTKKYDLIYDEWKEKLSGRKSFMLNTSIRNILGDGENALEKLRDMFHFFSMRDDLVLIWRPHPLLESTITSLRNDLSDKWKTLLRDFHQLKNGIFDDTPDLNRTVAIADAYIGEEESSVVTLFTVMGKPVFVLNDLIREAEHNGAKVHISLGSAAVAEDKIFCVYRNQLCGYDSENNKLKSVGTFPSDHRWHRDYDGLVSVSGRIWPCPTGASAPVSGKIKNNGSLLLDDVEKYDSEKQKYPMQCSGILTNGRYVVYLPGGKPDDLNYIVFVYDTESDKWKHFSKGVYSLSRTSGQEYMKNDAVSAGAIRENVLWMVAGYSRYILSLDLESGEERLHELGSEGEGFSCITYDKRSDCMWIAESNSGKVVRFDPKANERADIDMPEDFYFWKNNEGNSNPHKAILDLGTHLVTVPDCSNSSVIIDKRNGSAVLFIHDFYADALRRRNGYDPKCSGVTSGYVLTADGRILFQRAVDGKIACVDPVTGKYDLIEPEIGEDLRRNIILSHEEHFEKYRIDHCYIGYEDEFYMFSDFVEDLCSGGLENVKVRQMQDLDMIGANLDGTCGLKVHDELMRIF